MNSRAIACQNILNIIDKKSSLLTLETTLQKLDITVKDKSFIKALCYDFFRNYYSLESVIKPYINKSTKLKVKTLIMLGGLQILEMSQPNYAVINESVNACDDLKIEWAKGLLNAILRKIIKDIETVSTNFKNLQKYDLPEWLTQKLKKQYPDNYLDIFIASNKKAPMFIRVNKLKDKNVLLKHFENKNIEYNKTSLTDCLVLTKPLDVRNDILFAEGYFTVQDMSAQYAGHILNLEDNQNILDACAAPGGKTTHLLESNSNINLTAIDIIETRLKMLKDNVARFQYTNVDIIKHDLTKNFETKFDQIVLDAPCSALGVVRRNPDIKILRIENDVNNIIKLQSSILQNLWDNNLNDNGYLLYITCSILVEENDMQIEKFLEKNYNAKIVDIGLLSRYKKKYGYQILPSENKGDGFYYCLIHRF